MAEAIQNVWFSHLKELENKVGRKTPEGLLLWMRDSADCEGGWKSVVVDRADSALRGGFSDKINTLKEEMRGLRSADVKILWQLLAVHDGIEAMRWLMEERGALASRGSSLTGSLSSLMTMEEHGPSTPPFRESPTSTLTGEETEDKRPHYTKTGAGIIKRALLRSSRARSEVKEDTGGFILTNKPGERQTEHQTQESFTVTQNNMVEEDKSTSSREKMLQGYDAHLCWGDSHDDVTFV